MRKFDQFKKTISSRRAQHLVFLVHIWLCTPFLWLWLRDPKVVRLIGPETTEHLRPVVWFTFIYLLVRTWLAWIDPPKLRWEYIFPEVDVAIVTAILWLSHRGPMSNLSILFFLPIIEAAGTLRVKWAAFIGLLVVVGTALSSFAGAQGATATYANWRDLWSQGDLLNVSFRLYMVIIISSLMTYQALIAAGFREKLGAANARHKLSREIHDGVQGHLITVASQLELLSHVIDRDADRAKELAQDIRETARLAADELRFLVRRTESVAHDGEFLPAFRQYAHHQCSRNSLDLEFVVTGQEDVGNADWETMLFRIGQEALNNTIKHARASTVRISLVMDDRLAQLEVADDGEGFDIKACVEGMGMVNMRSRAGNLGGHLVVEAGPGRGTIVRATLPRGSRNG